MSYKFVTRLHTKNWRRLQFIVCSYTEALSVCVWSRTKMFGVSLPILLVLLHVNGGWCCSSHERDSLLQFKASVVDPSNQVLKSWHGFNCCDWNGIQCHPHTHHVIRLDLHGSYDLSYDACLSNLSGDVLSPLFDLEQLEHLDLSSNDFSGVPIPPGLGRFKSLRYLDLSNAGFAGDIPRDVGNMSTLHYLDLSGDYNYLRMMDMRTWTGNMRDLRELILRKVDMSRVESNEFDNALSTMYTLTRLQMSYCDLYREIPPSLASLTNLTHIQLRWNDFNGSIPAALLSLPRLQLLDLSSNWNLEGNLSRILPQHSPSLHTLLLSQTAVGGSIPDSVANISSLTVLDLSFCHVESIPITMANLTALTELYFFHNMLRGQIPPFGDRTPLRIPSPLAYIDLSYNQLDGPVPPVLLTAFPNLQHVDLSNNQLKGSIPSPAGNLHYLTHLDLTGNGLTGKIPPSIGQLLSLDYLDLSNNKLEGSIPLSISNLSKLTNLYLQSNRLSGEFSESHLDNLSQLDKVDISDNLLTAKFSPTWIPKFSLRTLKLSSCKLEGGFPTFLITQYEVYSVHLSNCSLAGNIPQWIWGVESLGYLNLSHNHFAGVLPHSLMGSQLYVLDLHSNNLQGRLPLLSEAMSVLDVSENQLSGSIPSSICQISSLNFLDLSNNKLTGKIPSSLKECSSIAMLNLENNLLEGKLPRQFEEMLSLQTLKLGGNGLDSYLPSFLVNYKQLEILDLSNNNMRGIIPNWVGQLSNLKILILRSNRFEGIIPSELTTLPLLQILDLSSNKFSGTIPATISSLQAMKNKSVTAEIFHFSIPEKDPGSDPIIADRETIINKAQKMEFVRSLALVKCIDLSNNNLSGEIPPNMGLLEGLIILNISRNHISGEIPKKLGKMVQLESLDLSHNQLSGTIPLDLQLLTFLEYLDVSHNNLSGKIPQGGQLYTFEASSFSNNSDLCGLQLNTTCCSVHQSKPCPASILPKINVDKIDAEEEEDIWWGVGLGISFAIGFSIVIGVLCLTTTWSRKCFQIMDNIIIYLCERFRK